MRNIYPNEFDPGGMVVARGGDKGQLYVSSIQQSTANSENRGTEQVNYSKKLSYQGLTGGRPGLTDRTSPDYGYRLLDQGSDITEGIDETVYVIDPNAKDEKSKYYYTNRKKPKQVSDYESKAYLQVPSFIRNTPGNGFQRGEIATKGAGEHRPFGAEDSGANNTGFNQLGNINGANGNTALFGSGGVVNRPTNVRPELFNGIKFPLINRSANLSTILIGDNTDWSATIYVGGNETHIAGTVSDKPLLINAWDKTKEQAGNVLNFLEAGARLEYETAKMMAEYSLEQQGISGDNPQYERLLRNEITIWLQTGAEELNPHSGHGGNAAPRLNRGEQKVESISVEESSNADNTINTDLLLLANGFLPGQAKVVKLSSDGGGDGTKGSIYDQISDKCRQFEAWRERIKYLRAYEMAKSNLQTLYRITPDHPQYADILAAEVEGCIIMEENFALGIGRVGALTKSVYYSVIAGGVVRYVGITNNVARRSAEHLRTKGIQIQELIPGLSVSDARAVEQALIEIHGLGYRGGTLMNKINSISPSNPEYAKLVQRGYELLKTIDYGGVL